MIDQDLIKRILVQIGENPDREGLLDTPARVSKMYQELFRGYDAEQMPKVTVVSNGSDGVNYHSLILDHGYFFSFCEHHMIPFFGSYSFGYIPDKYIIGASKIGRTIDYFSARLQIAERLCQQVVDRLESVASPEGIILFMSGRHLCKEMRGLKKFNSPFEVIEARGVLLENKNGCRDEFTRRSIDKFK